MSTLSETPGNNISGRDRLPTCDVEVTAVEPFGFWLLVGDAEYLVPLADYPTFRRATLDQIFDVRLIAPGQLRWETLDVDIEIEALESPEKFPLVWA